MLNVAQIGVGYWGPNLLRNLVTNENILVKIAVDRSDERQKYIINKYPGIKVTDNTDLIFEDNDIIQARGGILAAYSHCIFVFWS